MSSRQCLGGGGSSSGASVSLISRPHTLQRYLTLTLRSSPGGGGGGIGVVKLRSRPTPLFHRTVAITREPSTHKLVESAGINPQAIGEVRRPVGRWMRSSAGPLAGRCDALQLRL